MNNQFDNLPWHDTEIRDIQITSNEEDILRMWVVFPNANDDEAVCIEFYECYAFQSDMHFGVGINETIYSAYCLDDTSGLCRLRNSWRKNYTDLSDLREYSFITNSTNSEFRIFAKGYNLSNPQCNLNTLNRKSCNSNSIERFITLSENDRKTFELMLQCIADFKNKKSPLITLFSSLETLYLSLDYQQPDWCTKFSNNLENLDIILGLDYMSLKPFKEQFVDLGVYETIQNKDHITLTSIVNIENLILALLHSNESTTTEW